MSSDQPMLEINHISKIYHIYERPEDRLKQIIWQGFRTFYREFHALNGISFSVAKGETIGILGRNGAGKSTLLQIVTGTLHPTKGHVERRGRIAALLELGAGFNPEFTGEENVYLAASVLGLTEEEIRTRYDDILNFAGIGDFIKQPVKLYSSGMYARLAFAVAAHVDADILIIDEILSVGDAAFTQKCMRYIDNFKQHGSILFVTHDIAAATKLCDRVVWLEQGIIKEFGPAKIVCRHYMAGVHAEADDDGKAQDNFLPVDTDEPAEIVQPVVDPRDNLLKSSQVANRIQIFDFDSNAEWFGTNGAKITNVTITDQSSETKNTIYGGDVVNLCINVKANIDIIMPIVGFYIRDRLGQKLFGDNTFLTTQDSNICIESGQQAQAVFTFQMPYLNAGDYAVTAAIAEGTEASHVQHHWLDEALLFHVPTSHFAHGLVGIPMINISLSGSLP